MHTKQIFVLVLITIIKTNHCFPEEETKEWDYLMYSQRWPVTTCSQWEESNKTNTCNLPKNKALWTVHGIWPTKTGTDGPWFCNSAVKFQPDNLTPIMDDLNNFWVNVEANTKPLSFWEHEWKKHGTCSVTLPQLNSVFNFFNQGLVWNKLYQLDTILTSQKITPNSEGYSVEVIFNAIKTVLKKNPEINCVVDRKSKDSLISEIRICFDKGFELIDCDPKNPNHVEGDVISNCNLKKPVMYFDQVPGNYYDFIDKEFEGYYEERNFLINIYRLLKFFIWFTL